MGGVDKQALFDFLRDNLSLEMDDNNGVDYGREYHEVILYLRLINPETGKPETISEQRFSM